MTDTDTKDREIGAQRWIPREHEPLGPCTICGEPVYPASPKQVGSDSPVMHEECGW